MWRFFAIVILSGLLLPIPTYAVADDYLPTHYGVSLLAGDSYDPDTFGLMLLQGDVIADYDRIFWHQAPEALRIKFEINAGMTMNGTHRGVLSVDMLALYYLDHFKMGQWRPYAEAGIGVIYTDFQVEGQGSRVNFNPQVGIGVEYPLSKGGAMSVGVRLHHLSNGNLMDENRGVNSALLLIGYIF